MKVVAYVRSFFAKDTDKIVRPLTKIVDRLDHHAQVQSNKAVVSTEKAARLLSKSSDLRAESDRALTARNKIADTFGL